MRYFSVIGLLLASVVNAQSITATFNDWSVGNDYIIQAQATATDCTTGKEYKIQFQEQIPVWFSGYHGYEESLAWVDIGQPFTWTPGAPTKTYGPLVFQWGPTDFSPDPLVWVSTLYHVPTVRAVLKEEGEIAADSEEVGIAIRPLRVINLLVNPRLFWKR